MPFFRPRGRQVLFLHGKRSSRGAVRHHTLHTFRSLRDLREELNPERWGPFVARIEKENPGIEFNWDRLQSQAWMLVASDTHTKKWRPVDSRVLSLRRTIHSLHRQLERFRPSEAEDHEVLIGAGDQLRQLAYTSALLIGFLGTSPESAQEEKKRLINIFYSLFYPDTEGLIDQARQCFLKGNTRRACALFDKARKEDPLDPDILISEGVCYFENGKLDQAEVLFRRAQWMAHHRLPVGRKVFRWSERSVRPYARACYNLGLVEHERKHLREAIALWEEVLRLCPDDGIGVRFVLGPAYHRLGDLEKAIDFYSRYFEYPEQKYNLALARFERGEFREAVAALLAGFAQNVFIPPLLLGETVEKRDVYRCSGLETLEWAQNYAENDLELWTPSALTFLRAVWNDIEAREAVNELEAMRRGLNLDEDPSRRSHLIHQILEKQRRLLPVAAVNRITKRACGSISPQSNRVKAAMAAREY